MVLDERHYFRGLTKAIKMEEVKKNENSENETKNINKFFFFEISCIRRSIGARSDTETEALSHTYIMRKRTICLGMRTFNCCFV